MNIPFFKRLFYLAALVAGLFFSNYTTAQLKPAVADSFLNFIKSNKDRASVYITKNDTIIAFLNETKLMPLASTVKILVAVEFAKEASTDIIDKNSYVALSELNKYYLPNTDGNAHPSWLEYEKKNNHIKGDSVKLIDIARGMIMFSSNANTEYLMDLLGINNITSNIGLFGLKAHTSIYPLVASLLMYQNPKKISEDKILKAINKFSDIEYSKYVYSLHVQLKHDDRFKAAFHPEDLTLKMQKAWSDRLPASTTKDYVHLANILNNRKFLSDSTYKLIEEVLEFPMENKAFQAAFKQYGVKGGSTPFVLTHVIYLKTKSNMAMELAIFFNNLSPEEEKKLEGWLDPFEAQVIFDANFRARLRF
jgi:D-alanyl-D-alanine carboxypeptidase